MAIYAISDLHLSIKSNKPMDVFGPLWQDYTNKIINSWQSVVNDDDLVIIGGDISWAMYLEDACDDLALLNSLNGTKLIHRGNHDYWWQSASKMKNFFLENSFLTLNILQNSSYIYKDTAICGVRLWEIPKSENLKKDDLKIYERELIRLELSLKDMEQKISKSDSPIKSRIVSFHYPPLKDGEIDENVFSLLKRYDVNKCVYGHIHSHNRLNYPACEKEGITFNLVSCDNLDFKPYNLDF